MDLRVPILVAVILVTTISGWITAVRLRRRARRAIGRDLMDTELTSLKTWMNVEEAEERRRGGRLS
jgi:hypothetical protein